MVCPNKLFKFEYQKEKKQFYGVNMTLYKQLFTIIFISFISISAQTPEWKYIGKLNFPNADTAHARPFLITVDGNGRVYVASSKATTIAANNAIFFADTSDTVLTKWIDYDANGDSDTLTGNVGAIRGISTLGTMLFVNANVPYPRSKPNTVATQYLYFDGDTNNVAKFGFYITGAGYGTYINGLAVTKDTMVISGVTAGAGVPGPRARFYNFNRANATPAYGSWAGESNQEPGGNHNAGIDVIRDVAVHRDGDYSNPETVFFTTRNSYDASSGTGGIAIWSGGTQTAAAAYTGTRVLDPASELSFDRSIPYGIDVDKDGNLWVAGTDSTRRWVRSYTMIGSFAQNVDELPGQYSSTNPNAEGAPMTAPSDVALSFDGKTAYVADGGSRSVYKFKYMTPVGVNDNSFLNSYELLQNYPNPFNPSTLISYSLPKDANVKLVVMNTLGEEVTTLVNEYQSAGKYSKSFNASNFTSGVYFYTITTEFGSFSKKMILIR